MKTWPYLDQKFQKLIEGDLDRGARGQKSNLLGFVFVGCPLPVVVSMSKISHINPSFKESLLCKTSEGWIISLVKET